MQEDELKDFNYQIINKTQQDGKNYYNNELEITVTIKDNVRIKDIAQDEFPSILLINGITLNKIIYNFIRIVKTIL